MSRTLVIRQEDSGQVRVENGDGKGAFGASISSALGRLAADYGLSAEDGDGHTLHLTSEVIDTLMGGERPSRGQIHEGLVSG